MPQLKETCEKYLRTIQPLLQPDEFERSRAAVVEFMQPGGIGEQVTCLVFSLFQLLSCKHSYFHVTILDAQVGWRVGGMMPIYMAENP